MIQYASAAALKVALVLATAAGSATAVAGTADAATPDAGALTAANVTNQPPPHPDRHGRFFRVHFRNYQQCVYFANHDRNPRTHGWDCRRGGDRAFPWEYWH